ncbi:hypothetical protein Fmac_022204 [Flemingia macrophylla]|uniref:Bacterial surface antigen (D15) domain-containing protein n=1 Tax=Flemingia macrophylla TaxID=520843 RepID=A0ABD1LZ17_9FABA
MIAPGFCCRATLLVTVTGGEIKRRMQDLKKKKEAVAVIVFTPSIAMVSYSVTCNRFITPPSTQRPPFTRSSSFKCHSHSALFKTLVISSAAAVANGFIGGAGASTGGLGGGGRSGGGATGGGSFWSRLLFPSPATLADEPEPRQWDSHGLPVNYVVPLSKLNGVKRYRISEIGFFDLILKANIGSDDSLSEMVTLRAGSVYTKAQLQSELEALASCGMFEKVQMEGKTNDDGSISLTVSFKENTWPSAKRFRCIAVTEPANPVGISRPCLLPMKVHRDIVEMLIQNEATPSAKLLRRISDVVHKWYRGEGFVSANVVSFGNLGTDEIVCEVAEGDITKLNIQFLDKVGNVVKGKTQIPLVHRHFPMRFLPGYGYNSEVGKQVLRNLYLLGLFSNVELKPLADDVGGGVVVDVNLTENDRKIVDVSTEWNIVPERGGFPTLDSVQPGGTVTFGHRNLQGLNRSFRASVTTSNVLKPQDDLSFKFEYEHPYLVGVHSPSDLTLRVSCFNSKKLSPVFTGGTWMDNVPPIWVDRVGINANITKVVFPQYLCELLGGIKANITENFSCQNKVTYGLVMEEITTRDERCNICASGLRVLPGGGRITRGPPTTISGTLQAIITCDNTKSVNGAVVGFRNVFQFSLYKLQIDQTLATGTRIKFFNRHQLTMTRFFQLRSVEGKPPALVFVLHGHYGGCVGDLPSYDTFTLGGPYSVRGLGMGEIGAAPNILELAAELRVPIKGQYVYVFAEHGNDLRSSENVNGNPMHKRMGYGSSYGVGIKLGMVRAEYAVKHNSRTGAAFLYFGERF